MQNTLRNIKLIVLLNIFFPTIFVNADEVSHTSVAFLSGVGTPTPFIEMVRVRQLDIEPHYISGIAIGHQIWESQNLLSFELESSLLKHFERRDRFSVATAFLVRWLKTPWDRIINSSFSFGNGLSYATSAPDLERNYLEKTSRLLYHFSLELAFDMHREWDVFFRVHHRSGAFGLFNGVVGGSDFLCFGFRLLIY